MLVCLFVDVIVSLCGCVFALIVWLCVCVSLRVCPYLWLVVSLFVRDCLYVCFVRG